MAGRGEEKREIHRTLMASSKWTILEGFLLGGGILMAGLMLELSVGPVVWDAFCWPANALALAGFLLLVVVTYLAGRKVPVLRFLGTTHAAVPALVYAVVLTMVMGLVRQQVGGVWFNDMLSFWPFVLVYVYLAFILGLVILRRLEALTRTLGNSKASSSSITPGFSSFHRASRLIRRDVPFLLNHLGLFIVLTTATLGNADMQRLKMVTAVGEPEWRAIDQKQEVRELPLAIQLDHFVMETYEDGTPKRFASDVLVLTQSGKKISATVDVNKPLEVEGWKIYQYGYDTAAGKDSKISIFELVRDPWLPAVYTGIWMMLGGAVCMFAMGGRRKKA